MKLKFCEECGSPLEYYGPCGWSLGVWLYGCPKCNILWERHNGGSIAAETSEWKKNFKKLSEWKEWEEKRKINKKGNQQNGQNGNGQDSCQEELNKEKTPDIAVNSEEIINSISIEQKKIFSELIHLKEKERKLMKEINDCQRPAKKSRILTPRDRTVAACEEDLKAKTLDLHIELKEIQEEIVQNLNKVLNCSLNLLEIIRKYCP